MTRLGILTVDSALIVRIWDGWVAERTGIAAGDACGRPLAEVVPTVAERGLLARFQDVLASGQIQVLAPAFHHYLLPCPPCETTSRFDKMQQHVTLGPLREGDRIVGVMATIEDVTGRLDRARELADALRGADWRTRSGHVADIARTADRETVLSLVTSLRTQHRDFSVLSSALKLLSTSDVDVTAQLAELLHDADADLRIQAALALGAQHTVEAVDPLMRALEDPDTNVRYHAIEALGRLRASDAVDALAAIAEGGDVFLAFAAVDALTRINDARVAPRLLPLVRRPELVEVVADALGEFGGAEVVHPLVDALNGGAAAAPVARALAHLHRRFEQQYAGGAVIVDAFQRAIAPAGAQRILDAVASVDTADLRALVTMLGWLRGRAVERALARLLGNAAVRDDVIEAIVRQDAGVVDVLVEQLAADDADTRLAAIAALGRIGSRRAAAHVARLLSGDRAQTVAAAASLAQIGDPTAYESLLPLLAHDDAAVRQAAIGALNALGHPDMQRRVVALLESADPRERESAVRIVGYFGYRDAVDAMIARCDDPVESVRRAAVEHLPFLEDERVAGRLGTALSDDAPRVRAAAAQALARVPASEAEALLTHATDDADSWVRYFAVKSLGEVAGRPVLPRLERLAAGDPAMHVRLAAIEAIGIIGAADALQVLLPLVSDPNTELAAAALRSLGHASGDEPELALTTALRSADPTLRGAAVIGLRTRASRTAVDALAWSAAADADDAVARAAIEALGAIARRKSDVSGPAIDALLAVAGEPRLQAATVAALAGVPETHIARVAVGLEHGRPDVRRATVAVLARMKHPDASAAILGALDDDDPRVREAAVVSLEQLGTQGIARKLALLARQDPAQAVRRAASAALGRVDDGTR